MQNEIKFLYLSQKDMIEAGVLNMQKCVEVMDEALKLIGQGDYLHGGPDGHEHGARLFFPEEPRGPRMPIAGPDRRFMAMIGYVGGRFHMCGEKWYGSNRANVQKGLPRSILIVMLNDPDTGAPVALMEGNLISAMRTGAVPGVGAKYLAGKSSETVGVIGAGVISKACLMAIAAALNGLKEVKVFDIVESQREAFSREMSKQLNLKVYPVGTLEEAVRGSDVLTYATSGTKAPFTETKWIKDGAFVALVAPAEFEDDFFLKSRIVADDWGMHLAWRKEAEELGTLPEFYTQVHRLIKEGKLRDEMVSDLGQIALGKVPGRVDNSKRIILISGGLPTEDITWGFTVYEEAKKRGIGQLLTLWEKPHWA